jgi:hypothetical protein
MLAVLMYHGTAAPARPAPVLPEESVEEVPPQETPAAPAPEPEAPPNGGASAPPAPAVAEAHAEEVAAGGIRLSWFLILVLGPLALLGLTAPFGTTTLGLVAIAHIRRSAGRLYGMGLAVFDALLFPLLALDAVLLYFWGGTPAGVPVAIALNVGIVVLVWRTVRRRVDGKAGDESPEAARSRRRLGVWSLVLTVAGLVVGVGVAAVGHVFGLGAAWMVGYGAFFGLEVAALVCGILAWSATPVAKAGAIASAALMAASLLMLG